MAALANIPLYDASTSVSELYYSQEGPLDGGQLEHYCAMRCITHIVS